ncbi:hypothetical protein [Candidatus Enterovibrio escicola]|uniref:Virulence factor Evf domain-containing protein n=3 Tax=Candidatus Enterovibrio escicola TaxID=1927127 RepID=A0A2A5T2H4_9GAMM|nr:hypothetical protein [Candidatus Enterovibrio escacola]PCS22318.1 hypothetical protein BTN49_2047 [Candidatus Enterovibrio escacola]
MTIITKDRDQQFDTWLSDVKELRVPKELMPVRNNFVLSDLFSDSTVTGQNSIGCGIDANEQSKQGKLVDEAKERGDLVELTNLLASSTGNAVSSILGLAQSRTDWNPQDPCNINNPNGFIKFIEKLLTMPYFLAAKSEKTGVHYDNNNYDSLINNIVDLYTGLTESDKTLVKSSVISLAKACTSRVNTKNTKTLFIQQTLDASDRNIVVRIHQTFMIMEYDKQNNKGCPTSHFGTDLDVNVLELTFQGNLWSKEAAKKLANVFVQSWDDWLQYTTTPSLDEKQPKKYCFDKPELIME